MKSKSFFFLLIFLLSLIPFESVHASSELSRTLENSVSLMYVSDAILLNEIVDDETSSTSKLSAGTKPDASSDETTDSINLMINATKAQRNDHDRKCRETVEIYRQQGKTCEVDQTNAYCKSKRAELTAKIAALRKKRGGDRRKWFTKQWHGIKRAGARFWHKIGPLGRNFLREIGPQALKIVAAGGPGTEALLKNLLKHTAKNMARQRAKQIGFQALQRILKVQLDVAAAAGVDICEEEEKEGNEVSQELAESTTNDESSGFIDIPRDWNCGSTIGAYGAWMEGGDPNTIIDKSELQFILDANNPSPSYEFSFHGIVQIAMYGASDSLYYIGAEHLISGKGNATWDETNYFYGSVDIDRIELMTSAYGETTETTANWQNAVIGTLSPDQNEIQICFHKFTREQFGYIKNEPFGNLLEHCSSHQYFVCTPQE